MRKKTTENYQLEQNNNYNGKVRGLRDTKSHQLDQNMGESQGGITITNLEMPIMKAILNLRTDEKRSFLSGAIVLRFSPCHD